MRKFYALIVSFLCLGLSCVYADSPCDGEMKGKTFQNQQMRRMPNVQNPSYNSVNNDRNLCKCFLCKKQRTDFLFKALCLSDTQICTALKIQDKYELEVLSLNERIACEKEKLCALENNCVSGCEKREQKRLIKRLEKDKKQICECYEKQFKSILSDTQLKTYKKSIKCK